MTPLRTAILTFTLAATGCTSNQPATKSAESTSPARTERDVHSYAEPEKAVVTHVSLDLTPDFKARKLTGTAKLTIKRNSNDGTIVLDTRDLTIKRVTNGSNESLAFSSGPAKEFLGSPLTITLPPQGDTILIEYETSPDAAAVQWLSPPQTAGKKLPFLFTQGQAILTRTWVPTQDSPGIRQTYDAAIHVPDGMRAVMSAEHVAPEGDKDTSGLSVFRFKMEKPIPPYLFALAVGDIAFKGIGQTTGVYAEPSVVNRAAEEFAEVDK